MDFEFGSCYFYFFIWNGLHFFTLVEPRAFLIRYSMCRDILIAWSACTFKQYNSQQCLWSSTIRSNAYYHFDFVLLHFLIPSLFHFCITNSAKGSTGTTWFLQNFGTHLAPFDCGVVMIEAAMNDDNECDGCTYSSESEVTPQLRSTTPSHEVSRRSSVPIGEINWVFCISFRSCRMCTQCLL